MTRPHPHFWTPIAHLLAALRALLRATAPQAFASIALEARAQLAALTALVRRYIHVLAADIVLPPQGPLAPYTKKNETSAAPRARRYRFALLEQSTAKGSRGSGADPPGLQWALLMQAADRLAEVMANPDPHARRLARALRQQFRPPLRELPVRWHVIRRLGPGLDTLLMQLDAAARPADWAGLDTS